MNEIKQGLLLAATIIMWATIVIFVLLSDVSAAGTALIIGCATAILFIIAAFSSTGEDPYDQ